MAGPENSMIAVTRHPDLILALQTEKGRAVYASRDIPARTVIEVSPVLVLPPSEVPLVKKTFINHYSYNWPIKDATIGGERTTQAIALGLGSIFNHSRNQNVGYKRDVDSETIIYSTLQDVASGEELCISYGPRLWFEDAEEQEDSVIDIDDPLLDISRIEVHDKAVDLCNKRPEAKLKDG